MGLDTLELMWAAGFWDGEGCMTLNSRPNGKQQHACTVVNLTQVEREPLERFVSAVGVGKIYGPYSNHKNKNMKPCHQYTGTRREDVAVLENLLYPLVCQPKRDQFEEKREKVRQIREEAIARMSPEERARLRRFR